MSRRFKVCLVAWIAVIAFSAWSQRASAQTLDVSSAPQPAADTPTQSVLELQPAVEQPPAASTLPVLETQPIADHEWTISISPALKVYSTTATHEVAVQPAGDCENCQSSALKVNPADYTRIYNSIPFNRAEYRVNPSYRHDSTMEILTGNARHKTIVKHDSTPKTTQVSRPYTPGMPYVPGAYPGAFIRPGVRLNYYRYFPSLNPYLSVWNLNGVF